MAGVVNVSKRIIALVESKGVKFPERFWQESMNGWVSHEMTDLNTAERAVMACKAFRQYVPLPLRNELIRALQE